MRLTLSLVALGACGFQPRAATATGDGAGGDTSMIDARVIDVMIDAPRDTDGDGVFDSIDNCPTVANADQRDHDVDGRGDVCDLCPHIAETADTDTDGDGVGDACDPRPTIAGDTRALWVGFYDPTEIATWAKSAGTWTVSNGKLTGGAANQQLLAIWPNQAFQHAFAQTGAHFNTLATPSGSVSPSAVLYTGDAGAPQYYACQASATNNGNVIYASATYSGQPHFDQVAWPGTLAAGTDVMLTDAVDVGSHTCTVTQGSTNITKMQNAGPQMGVVALGTSYATVSFDYLFVVETGQ